MAKTATNFRKTIKRLKMVYFTILYCWLTIGATTVNIPLTKNIHRTMDNILLISLIQQLTTLQLMQMMIVVTNCIKDTINHTYHSIS